jgi:hypothetical protein
MEPLFFSISNFNIGVKYPTREREMLIFILFNQSWKLTAASNGSQVPSMAWQHYFGGEDGTCVEIWVKLKVDPTLDTNYVNNFA